jgi:hypothetical protein
MRGAEVSVKPSPEVQKPGFILGPCGPQATWADLGHFAMLALGPSVTAGNQRPADPFLPFARGCSMIASGPGKTSAV